MSPIIPVLLGLLGLAGLTVYCANHHRPHFEADLSSRSQQALNGASIPNIGVGAEGQIVTLTGEVSDEATKRKAGEEAARVFGVEEVRNEITIKAVASAPVMTREERVAAETCQVTFNRLLKQDTIRFATASPTIRTSSFPLLDRIAEAAKGCPAASVEIGGHTDADGSMTTNMKLSQARAESVMNYLRGKGVESARLTPIGYGPSRPVADNSTPAGMQQNRRTELKVKGL